MPQVSKEFLGKIEDLIWDLLPGTMEYQDCGPDYRQCPVCLGDDLAGQDGVIEHEEDCLLMTVKNGLEEVEEEE